MSGDLSPLPAGTQVGPYRIERLLGVGGMGQVYRAFDTRLARPVALKFLHPDVASDPKRVRRFEQEARAASALNHVNLAVVYEVGEAPRDGAPPLRYLAMELIEGRGLDSVLTGPKLPLRRCLEIALGLADGLAAAHEAGIVHRDLKPSNVLVARDGRPKLIDFGLAKLWGVAMGPGEVSDETLTTPGSLMGTVGYMSPEQARGEVATAASDQFALGCILYEMLTNRRAFEGASPAETLSAILRDQPRSLREVAPDTPLPLAWVVDRCLAKAASDRYASTRDLAGDLGQLLEHVSDPGLWTAPPRHPPPRGRGMRSAVAGTALVALALAATAWLSRVEPREEPEFRPLTFRRGLVAQALFAPRSEAILYTAAWDGQPPRTYQALPDSPGADRSLDAEEQFPLGYSADGSQVLVLLGAFAPALGHVRGTLAWWPALGGKARPVMEGAGWADWAERGRFLVVVRNTGSHGVIEVRDAAGALQRALFQADGAISHVRISPDEQHVAFLRHPNLYGQSGEVWVVGSDGSSPRALTATFDQLLGLDWNRRSGELWFSGAQANYWGSTLWAVGLSGRPRALHALPSMFVLTSVAPSGDRCLLIDIDHTASLVARHPGRPLQDLTWFGWSVVTDLSADGRHVLFFDSGATTKTQGTWMRPIEGGDAVRLAEGTPSRFSPDGRLIVTPTSHPTGPPQLELVPIGPGERRQLSSSSKAAHAAPSFAGDTTLLFERSESGMSEVWRMETDGRNARSLGAPACEMPEASPSLISFACIGEAGRAIFVYPMEKGPGRKLYERALGGRFYHVRWNRKGDRLYAVTSDRRFMTLDATRGGVLAEETLPTPSLTPYDKLVGAAFDADARVQVYSVEQPRSGLFLMTVS